MEKPPALPEEEKARRLFDQVDLPLAGGAFNPATQRPDITPNPANGVASSAHERKDGQHRNHEKEVNSFSNKKKVHTKYI
ncbi:MAG: hypothetical protein ACFCU3_03955 [Verrucomicrobiales bacterium]